MSLLIRMSSSRMSRTQTIRRFTADAAAPKLVRREVSKEERAALRAARKERATKRLAQAGLTEASSSSSSVTSPMFNSRWVWYLGVAVPTALIAWGLNDENSPPAKLYRWTGLSSYTDMIAMPSHDKLLPDWSQMPNVPHDIPVPHTLVLDLESTLVCSTWDRKYGWRHAKRPGVDKFLQDMAQYYEIVLYSPSIDAIAEPVVNSLDKNGCIMHRLYRDATYYKNGIHIKDLNRLNRNVNRMIVLDDDADEVQLNPDNLIRVKPYDDPNDREDRTLERITPFLIEIAREGYNDIPSILRQYRGMDADEIADEQERRISQIRDQRQRKAQRGLGRLARRASINNPVPENAGMMDTMTTSGVTGLTSKELVGSAPSAPSSGMMGWLNKRGEEKEEQQRRKMEHWNEVMLRKQQAKREAAEAAAKQSN